MDTQNLLQLLIAIGTCLSFVGGFVCKKVWEGVGVLKEILVQVSHLDKKLGEVQERVLTVEKFMGESSRDRATLHLVIEDLKRRTEVLEIKIRELMSDHN